MYPEHKCTIKMQDSDKQPLASSNHDLYVNYIKHI